MQGHKRKVFIFLMILVMIPVFFVMHKAEANRTLKAQWIKDYIEGKDQINNKENILEIVLKDTNYTEWHDKKDKIGLNILKADLLGDSKKELLLTLFLAPKKSLIVVYQQENGDYKYVDILDEFFEIKEIQAIPIEKRGKDLIVVREFVDQMLGAFEKGNYIRGYLWQDGKFNMVISLIENYVAYWNESWDQAKKPNPLWLKIEEKSIIQWENGPYPVIKVLENQFFYQSKTANLKEMPEEEDYQLVNSKELVQTYYWNEKYQHFLIAEGKDVKTGESIGIIEDLSLSPFQLAGFEKNQYRIKRKNGKIEFVSKSQIIRTDKNNPLRKSEDFVI